MVIKVDLFEEIRKDAEMYAGCVSRVLEPDNYFYFDRLKIMKK